MKIEQQHIDLIRQKFASMQNKEDLVSLLSEAKNILYGKECKPFELRSITYYANPDLCKKRYSIFTIKKKSGGERIINAPVKGLKSILRSLNFVLQCMYEPHKAANGFVLNKSIVDNAKVHVGNYYVYNIDLKDFFHSFDRNRVKMAFLFEPFNLNGDREPLAFLLACLCTHPFEVDGEIINVLPQGSPTSPTITNILCKKMDRRLTGLAKRFGAKYTRYADDITFSSLHNIYNDNGDFKKELERIISEDNLLKINGNEKVIGLPLKINSDKTRLQKSAYRQEVTGLIVNEKVNVRKRYVKQIRMWLYYWEKYGYEKAQQIFTRDYITDKGHVKKGKPNLINVLDGKLKFLKMVKGEEDSTYKTLKRRFEKLTIKSESKSEAITNENVLEDEENIIQINYPILHSPYKTVILLKNFSSNDNDLKYATHSWEYGKYDSYDDFIKRIENDWKVISKDLKTQNNRLYAKIYNFLFNKELGNKNEKGYYISWGEKYLKFGWSSPELKNFVNSTKNDPMLCPIPDRIRELDKEWKLFYFKDYVDVFKNEIEFREDTNNLKKLFLDKRKEILRYDFKIELLNTEGKSFYTDVAYFSKIIEIIFLESFKPRTQFPNILVNVLRMQNFFLLTITQEGSPSTRFVDDERFTSPTGTLKTICNEIKNLADFSICATFKDEKCYRINYLVSIENIQFIEELPNNPYGGFTYEFKFYI